MSAGSLRERSPGAFELKFDLPRGVDGTRRTRTETFRGSKKEARARLRELLSAVDKGTHVDASKTTVAELVRERIALWQVSASTREGYLTDAKMLDPIGTMAAQKLTTRDVERWHGELRERGLSPATIRKAHRLLTRVFGEAARHGLVSRNVAQEQTPPRSKRSTKVQIVTAEQIPEMLAKLHGDWFHAPVVVAVYCGMRRGELLALRWCDIDLDGATMTIARALEETTAGVSVKSTKTESGERTISLPTVVVAALRAHRRGQLERRLLLGLGKPSDGLLFPNHEGGYQSPRSFSVRWGRTAARLGIPEATWHSLRHAHASMLINAGVPITTVAARLGHASPSVTLSIYAHLFTKDDRAAAAAINAALGG